LHKNKLFEISDERKSKKFLRMETIEEIKFKAIRKEIVNLDDC
jgi:hypothetical protein